MKVAEILFLGSNLLKTLHKSGVKLQDCEYIPLYQEYMERCMSGEKVTYIVIELAKKYHVSERFVYKLIKRLEKDCTIGAV